MTEYLAGFFDGEGCIGIYLRKGRYTSYRFHIAVNNTHKGVIELFRAHFNCGYVHRKDRHRKGHAICWEWGAASNEALMVLEALVPYLVVKKDEALLAIEFQRHVQKTRCHRGIVIKEYRQSVTDRMHTMKDVYKEISNG